MNRFVLFLLALPVLLLGLLATPARAGDCFGNSGSRVFLDPFGRLQIVEVRSGFRSAFLVQATNRVFTPFFPSNTVVINNGRRPARRIAPAPRRGAPAVQVNVNGRRRGR